MMRCGISAANMCMRRRMEQKVPFLSQPPRHYTGKAWYQKTIFVPEKSDGFVGRLTLDNTKWKTTLWIDGECKGSIVSLCAPHVYETGALSAGEHTVTLCIDNGWQLSYRQMVMACQMR